MGDLYARYMFRAVELAHPDACGNHADEDKAPNNSLQVVKLSELYSGIPPPEMGGTAQKRRRCRDKSGCAISATVKYTVGVPVLFINTLGK